MTRSEASAHGSAPDPTLRSRHQMMMMMMMMEELRGERCATPPRERKTPWKKSKTRQLSGVVSPPPSPLLARRTDHSARPSSGPPGESTPRRDSGSMVVSRRSACWAAFCRAARMGSVCARIIASSSSSCELHPIISQSITARLSQQLRPAPRLADGDARSLCFYTVKMLFC